MKQILYRGRTKTGTTVEGVYMERHHSTEDGKRVDVIFWSNIYIIHQSEIEEGTLRMIVPDFIIDNNKLCTGDLIFATEPFNSGYAEVLYDEQLYRFSVKFLHSGEVAALADVTIEAYLGNPIDDSELLKLYEM